MFWPRVGELCTVPRLLRAQPITSMVEANTRPSLEARSLDSALPQGESLVWKVRGGTGSLAASAASSRLLHDEPGADTQARSAAEREPRADAHPKFAALARGGGQGRSWSSREGYQPRPAPPRAQHSAVPGHRLRALPRDTGPELGASPAAPAPLPTAAVQSAPACSGARGPG